MRPQVEAWTQGVHIIGKITKRHPQYAYVGLGMSLQLDWHYLQRTVPGVGTLMGPIEESLRDNFFLTLLGGEEVNAKFRKS